MDRWKAERGRVREKRRVEERRAEARRSEERESQKKEDAGARKGRRVGKKCVFPKFVAPEGRKVGSLKRRVRSLLARWEMKNCTPLWFEAHFEVNMYKTHQVRTTFGSWDVEKVHAAVSQSTFRSQNVRNNAMLGPLLEVEMSKKCTPLWREAHFEVKMYEAHHASTTFGYFWKLPCRKSARRCVAKHISKSKCTKHTMLRPLLDTFGSCHVEKVHAVVARSTFRSQNIRSTPGSDHFWKLRCRKSARRCGAKHISKSKYTKHTRFGPLLEVEMSKKCTPLWREDARSTFRSQNVQCTTFLDHFWKSRCRKSACRCCAKHISKSKCWKHQGFGHPYRFGRGDLPKM